MWVKKYVAAVYTPNNSHFNVFASFHGFKSFGGVWYFSDVFSVFQALAKFFYLFRELLSNYLDVLGFEFQIKFESVTSNPRFQISS